MEKVIVKLDPDWHGNSTETLWAIPWFKEKSYQIQNIPFYAKGISLNDVIEISEGENGVKHFKNILKKSGHSTYRIFLTEKVSDEMFYKYWLPLENIGCSYEKAFNRFYSINVPSETDIYQTYSLLEIGETNGIWDFEEADVGHELNA